MNTKLLEETISIMREIVDTCDLDSDAKGKICEQISILENACKSPVDKKELIKNWGIAIRPLVQAIPEVIEFFSEWN